MLDPTRYALNAETVGFRKRMKQNVDWGAFNEALQTQTDSIKVRREIEETPISELHVMGGQRFGFEGNAKTNERARQHRQVNGYVLRSFLATGGPVILPPKKNDSLLGIPSRFGQVQYTPNAVLGQQYVSAFTEPLNAPLENNTILLGRQGIAAKSESLSNPYAALQFQLNMNASQQQIQEVEESHRNAKSRESQNEFRRQQKVLKAPKEARKVLSLLEQIKRMRPTPPVSRRPITETDAGVEADFFSRPQPPPYRSKEPFDKQRGPEPRTIKGEETFPSSTPAEPSDTTVEEALAIYEKSLTPFDSQSLELSAERLSARYNISIEDARIFLDITNGDIEEAADTAKISNSSLGLFAGSEYAKELTANEESILSVFNSLDNIESNAYDAVTSAEDVVRYQNSRTPAVKIGGVARGIKLGDSAQPDSVPAPGYLNSSGRNITPSVGSRFGSASNLSSIRGTSTPSAVSFSLGGSAFSPDASSLGTTNLYTQASPVAKTDLQDLFDY